MGQTSAGTVQIFLKANLTQFKTDMQDGTAVASRATRQLATDVKANMYEAKGSMMLLGEEVGVHIPRHLQTLIAQIPGVGALFANMLPIIGIVAAIGLIVKVIDHLEKLKEAHEKLAQAQAEMGEVAQKSFNDLDDKLLHAGITMDTLRGDHVAALNKELKLIDHQSFRELEGEFGILAKAADAVFAQLKASWHEIGSGSVGAKHALDDFKIHYDMLLATGKNKEASDLLAGTLKSAQDTLKTMEAAKKEAEDSNDELRQGGGPSQKELDAQHTLIDALNAQVVAQQKIEELRKTTANNKTAEDTIRQEKESVAATIEGEDEKLVAIRAAIAKEQAAGRANGEFAKGLIRERNKIIADGYKEAVRQDEENLRKQKANDLQWLKIVEDLDDAIVKDKKKKGEEWINEQDRLNMEEFKQSEAMASLKRAAAIEDASHNLKMRQSTIKQNTDLELKAENDEYKSQVDAWLRESALLDKNDKEYLAKQKALDNQMEREAQLHENRMKQIKDKGEEEQYKLVHAAEDRMAGAVANAAAQSIMSGKNMAQAFEQLGKQMLQTALTNFLQMETLDGRQKLSDAKTAARGAYTGVMDMNLPPFIAFPLAIASGAAAFAGVMAFEQGGIIPGNYGDAVPIMGHAEEMVLPADISNGLQNLLRSPGSDGGKGARPHVTNFNIATPDASSFRHSQGQIKAKEQHAQAVAARRNR